MKKMVACMMLMVMGMSLTGAPGAAAQESLLEGVILEVGEEGSFLMEAQDMGEVLVHLLAETAVEGVPALGVGQYVFVTYSGAMTRSLPPQVSANKVTCHALQGEVVFLDEAAETILVETLAHGRVLVRLPALEALPQAGAYVTVYFSGIMALSDPAQAGGLKVDVHASKEGTVTQVREDYFLMEAQGEEIRVNVGPLSLLPASLQAGDAVRVYYDGRMTFSLPPQVFGQMVLPPAGE